MVGQNHVLALLLAVGLSDGYQIYDQLDPDTVDGPPRPVFEPYHPGFVGTVADPANPKRYRVNEGNQFTFTQPNIFMGVLPRQVCPGMIGPVDEDLYFCTQQEAGYCDRRSGTCFCFGGYQGTACEECASSHYRNASSGLCEPRQLCPRDCSGAGKCDPATGVCSCSDHRMGDDCGTPVCPSYHDLCVECSLTGCTKCVEGYYLTDTGVCAPCTVFDPRCLSCTHDQGCVQCADPLLNSIRRSGRRWHEQPLPWDEYDRELARTLPFGTLDPLAFSEAEAFYLQGDAKVAHAAWAERRQLRDEAHGAAAKQPRAHGTGEELVLRGTALDRLATTLERAGYAMSEPDWALRNSSVSAGRYTFQAGRRLDVYTNRTRRRVLPPPPDSHFLVRAEQAGPSGDWPVPGPATPLHDRALACDRSLRNDSTWTCVAYPVSHAVCGHPGTLGWASPQYAVREDDRHVRVAVVRSGGGLGRVNVDYALVHWNTSEADVSLADPQAGREWRSLTFEEGVVQLSFLLDLHDDLLVEGNETALLTLRSPDGGASLGPQHSSVLTIIEDDWDRVNPAVSELHDVGTGPTDHSSPDELAEDDPVAASLQGASAAATCTAGDSCPFYLHARRPNSTTNGVVWPGSLPPIAGAAHWLPEGAAPHARSYPGEAPGDQLWFAELWDAAPEDVQGLNLRPRGSADAGADSPWSSARDRSLAAGLDGLEGRRRRSFPRPLGWHRSAESGRQLERLEVDDPDGTSRSDSTRAFAWAERVAHPGGMRYADAGEVVGTAGRTGFGGAALPASPRGQARLAAEARASGLLDDANGALLRTALESPGWAAGRGGAGQGFRSTGVVRGQVAWGPKAQVDAAFSAECLSDAPEPPAGTLDDPSVYAGCVVPPAAGDFDLHVWHAYGGGLQGEYFPNPVLQAPAALSRVDHGVNFTWDEAPVYGSAADGISTRWWGAVRVTPADLVGLGYNDTFSDGDVVQIELLVSAGPGDQARLWLDHQIGLDKWGAQNAHAAAASTAAFAAIPPAWRDAAAQPAVTVPNHHSIDSEVLASGAAFNLSAYVSEDGDAAIAAMRPLVDSSVLVSLEVGRLHSLRLEWRDAGHPAAACRLEWRRPAGAAASTTERRRQAVPQHSLFSLRPVAEAPLRVHVEPSSPAGAATTTAEARLAAGASDAAASRRLEQAFGSGSVAWGRALVEAVAGSETGFTIAGRDRFGNDRGEHGADDEWRVVIVRAGAVWDGLNSTTVLAGLQPGQDAASVLTAPGAPAADPTEPAAADDLSPAQWVVPGRVAWNADRRVHDVRYRPSQAGSFEVHVDLWTDWEEWTPLAGSPFPLVVHPGEVVAGQSNLTGSGLESGMAGVPGPVFLTARDGEGNRVATPPRTPEPFVVTAVNADSGHTVSGSLLPVQAGIGRTSLAGPLAGVGPEAWPAGGAGQGLVGGGGGDRLRLALGFGLLPGLRSADGNADPVDPAHSEYAGQYVPRKSGRTVVSVTRRGVHAKGSPFEIVVEPGPTAGHRCTATGDALALQVATLVNSFEVHMFDEFDNRRPASSGDDVRAFLLVRNATGHEQAVPSTATTDLGGGSYQVGIVPTLAGVWPLHVVVGGLDVRGSPFPVEVRAGPTVPAHSPTWGVGLSAATSAVRASFFVQARDRSENNQTQPVNATSQAVEATLTLAVAAPGAWAGREADVAPVDAVVRPAGAGLYEVSYVLRVAGEWSIEVLLLGAPVQGSPHGPVTCAPNAMAAATSLTTGGGLSGDGFVIDQLHPVTVQARDAAGNDVGAGSEASRLFLARSRWNLRTDDVAAAAVAAALTRLGRGPGVGLAADEAESVLSVQAHLQRGLAWPLVGEPGPTAWELGLGIGFGPTDGVAPPFVRRSDILPSYDLGGGLYNCSYVPLDAAPSSLSVALLERPTALLGRSGGLSRRVFGRRGFNVLVDNRQETDARLRWAAAQLAAANQVPADLRQALGVTSREAEGLRAVDTSLPATTADGRSVLDLPFGTSSEWAATRPELFEPVDGLWGLGGGGLRGPLELADSMPTLGADPLASPPTIAGQRDAFSVRWEGWVAINETGEYRWTLSVADTPGAWARVVLGAPHERAGPWPGRYSRDAGGLDLSEPWKQAAFDSPNVDGDTGVVPSTSSPGLVAGASALPNGRVLARVQVQEDAAVPALPQSVTSDPISLQAGMMYPIVVEYDQGDVLRKGGVPHGPGEMLPRRLISLRWQPPAAAEPGPLPFELLLPAEPDVLQGSPHHPYTRPAAASPPDSTASGLGLTEAIAGVRAYLEVVVRDHAGNLRHQGDDDVYALVRLQNASRPLVGGPDGVRVKSETVPRGGPLYALEYQTVVSGSYEIDVTVNAEVANFTLGTAAIAASLADHHVAGSPYPGLVVWDGAADARFSEAYGPGLYSAIAGQPTQFRVQVRDTDGNNRTRTDPGVASVTLALVPGQHLEPLLAPMAPSESQLTLDAALSAAPEADGLFTATYAALVAGEYEVRVQVNGSSIPGSPFNLTVHPAAALPSRSYTRGLGADGGLVGTASPPQSALAQGGPANFSIVSLDRFGNRRENLRRAPEDGEPPLYLQDPFLVRFRGQGLVRAHRGAGRVTPAALPPGSNFTEVQLQAAANLPAGTNLSAMLEDGTFSAGMEPGGAGVYEVDVLLATTSPQEGGAKGYGLRASYFTDRWLQGEPAVERLDAQLLLEWPAYLPTAEGASAEPSGTRLQSARWRGWVRAPATGDFYFRARTTEGQAVRVSVGHGFPTVLNSLPLLGGGGPDVVGQVDDQDQGWLESGRVILLQGQVYEFEAEWMRPSGAGSAAIELQWRYASGAEELAAWHTVPATSFFPDAHPVLNSPFTVTVVA